jgi:hypothetical protein
LINQFRPYFTIKTESGSSLSSLALCLLQTFTYRHKSNSDIVSGLFFVWPVKKKTRMKTFVRKWRAFFCFPGSMLLITIFCDFRQFSEKKIGVFLKNQCYDQNFA